MLASAKSGDAPQIYLLPASGGQPIAITHVTQGVSAFHWSPKGGQVAFITDDDPPATDNAHEAMYGKVNVVGQQGVMSHLWTLAIPADPKTGSSTPVRLTHGPFSVADMTYSPDGTRLAFTAQRGPDQANVGSSAVYTVSVDSHVVTRLADTPGQNLAPLWSPDGALVAFLTPADPTRYFYSNAKVAMVSADGGPSRVIDPSFDEDAQPVAWTADGIYFTAFQRTDSGLFLLEPKTGRVREISPAHMTLSDASVAATGRAAFLCAKPDHAKEVCTINGPGAQPRALTSLDDAYTRFSRTTRDVVRWHAPDGVEVEGVLEKPADFQPGKRYPLLVIVHGGPQWMDTPYRSPDHIYPAQQFLARGALVLRPNYRGSSGYGDAFRGLSFRTLGVSDSTDVVAGVDALVARGLVDGKRVGVMGWSAGGFISAFLATSSDRFRAISVGAGITDYAGLYANSDLTDLTVQYVGKTPWEDPAIYAAVSPMTRIAQARTPTLIQHGEKDIRIPISQAYEFNRGLLDHHVPVRMVVYKESGHALTKPKQMRAVMEENERWFGHYIWGDEPAPVLEEPSM